MPEDPTRDTASVGWLYGHGRMVATDMCHDDGIPWWSPSFLVHEDGHHLWREINKKVVPCPLILMKVIIIVPYCESHICRAYNFTFITSSTRCNWYWWAWAACHYRISWQGSGQWDSHASHGSYNNTPRKERRISAYKNFAWRRSREGETHPCLGGFHAPMSTRPWRPSPAFSRSRTTAQGSNNCHLGCNRDLVSYLDSVHCDALYATAIKVGPIGWALFYCIPKTEPNQSKFSVFSVVWFDFGFCI